MKKLFSLVALLIGLAVPAQAQQLMSVTSLAAHTATSVLAASYLIDNFVVINSTTNTAILRFYDSNTSATNMAQAATYSYATWATNYTVVFTNYAGVLVTNSFVGVYTGPTAAVAGATVAKPAMLQLAIPAGTTLNKDVKLLPVLGLAAQCDQAVTLVTTYRRN